MKKFVLTQTKEELQATLNAVAGKQEELNANNKLNPAYINTDANNRFVTDLEKAAWSGKQDELIEGTNISIDASNKISVVAEPTFTSVSAANYYGTSDRRLKTNIKEYSCEKSVLDLPVVEFDYIYSGTHTIGCIAQDLQEICPEIVHEAQDGYLAIEENKLIYLLLEEVKKLKKEVEELKK